MTTTTLGQRIRDLRTAAELTQGELAEAAGISQQHLSQIENDGRPRIAFGTVTALADALGVTVDELRP